MNIQKQFIYTIVLMLYGCSSTEKIHENFSSKSDKWICGKFYKFEYYTGERDFVTSKERSTAEAIILERGSNCDYYYSDLKRVDEDVRALLNDKSHSNSNSNSKGSAALLGTALCAFSGNPKACMTGVSDGLEDDDDIARKRKTERNKRQQELQKEALDKMNRDQEIEQKVKEMNRCTSYKCK